MPRSFECFVLVTEFSRPVLDLEYNSSSSDKDMFKFDDLIDYATTLLFSKQPVLKISAKIFDSLGLLGPFVV